MNIESLRHLVVMHVSNNSTGAPKLINSDLFLEKRATVPIKTQGVQ